MTSADISRISLVLEGPRNSAEGNPRSWKTLISVITAFRTDLMCVRAPRDVCCILQAMWHPSCSRLLVPGLQASNCLAVDQGRVAALSRLALSQKIVPVLDHLNTFPEPCSSRFRNTSRTRLYNLSQYDPNMVHLDHF